MILNKKVLAVVPARGGSKAIPRKNLKILAGKPLLAWTIEAAKESRYIDRLVLSTEDEEIACIGKSYGIEVPFCRPFMLAEDHVPATETVLHALDQLPGYDYVVLLQPTSPLRRTEDIDGCIAECIQKGATSCVSVVEADKNPYLMFQVNDDGRMRLLIQSDYLSRGNRQSLPPVFVINGSVYVSDCQMLKERKSFFSEETVAYQMPRERSVDIDTEMDFLFAEAVLELAKTQGC